MKDYRLKENRLEYFTALYKMNLEYGVMPVPFSGSLDEFDDDIPF